MKSRIIHKRKSQYLKKYNANVLSIRFTMALPECASMPKKQWLQAEFGSEVVRNSLLSAISYLTPMLFVLFEANLRGLEVCV